MASHADAALHTHGLAVRDNKIVALDPVRSEAFSSAEAHCGDVWGCVVMGEDT